MLKQNAFEWKLWLKYAAIFIILIVINPNEGFFADIGFWRNWCYYGFQNGLENIYKSESDYPPLYLYVLYFFGKLQNNPAEIYRNIFQLKVFCAAGVSVI